MKKSELLLSLFIIMALSASSLAFPKSGNDLRGHRRAFMTNLNQGLAIVKSGVSRDSMRQIVSGIKEMGPKINPVKRSFSFSYAGRRHEVKPNFRKGTLKVNDRHFPVKEITRDILSEALGQNDNNRFAQNSIIKKLGNLVMPTAHADLEGAGVAISTVSWLVAIGCFLLSFTIVLAPITLPIALISAAVAAVAMIPIL